MPVNPVSTAWSSLQWAVTTIIGLLVSVYGAIFMYLFAELGRLKDRQDTFSRDAAAHSKDGDESLWEALNSIREKLDVLVAKEEFIRLQESIEADRRLAAQDRANIAVMMATKNELERQLDAHYNRLITTVTALQRHDKENRDG